MKFRKNFVSNSSSTSFILSSEADFQTARDHHIEWYYVSDLLMIIEDLRSTASKLPSFIGCAANLWVDYEQELRELAKNDPETCITEAYDRDLAYEYGIDLPSFATDL